MKRLDQRVLAGAALTGIALKALAASSVVVALSAAAALVVIVVGGGLLQNGGEEGECGLRLGVEGVQRVVVPRLQVQPIALGCAAIPAAEVFDLEEVLGSSHAVTLEGDSEGK